MRRQQQVWQEEHKHESMLPMLASQKPSQDVVSFIHFLQKRNVNISGHVVDIGCGKGRNAIYLAQSGLIVDAMDYIQEALEVTQKFAKEERVLQNITLHLAEIDKRWIFPDNHFDYAIDCFSSIDIETLQGRETYRDEMWRTLQPNGYALVTVVSVNDEAEKEFLKKSPGPEPNSVIWPESGKFQKNYTEAELRSFYQSFSIVQLRKVNNQVFKLGKKYLGEYYWLVLQKPKI